MQLWNKFTTNITMLSMTNNQPKKCNQQFIKALLVFRTNTSARFIFYFLRHDVRFLPLENPLLVYLSGLYNTVHGAFSSSDDLYRRNSLYKQNSQHVTSVVAVLRSDPSVTHLCPSCLWAVSSPILLLVHADGIAHGGLLTHTNGCTFKCLCLKFIEKAWRKTCVTAYFPCLALQQLTMAHLVPRLTRDCETTDEEVEHKKGLQ